MTVCVTKRKSLYMYNFLLMHMEDFFLLFNTTTRVGLDMNVFIEVFLYIFIRTPLTQKPNF